MVTIMRTTAKATAYTGDGLQRLAEIIKQARGAENVFQFSKKVGISHSSIGRLERMEINQPDIATFEKLAPIVGYSVPELIAICSGENALIPVRTYYEAEQVYPVVDQLPPQELSRLAIYIVKKMGSPVCDRRKPVMQDEDYSHFVAGLPRKQLSALLRAIALRLEAED